MTVFFVTQQTYENLFKISQKKAGSFLKKHKKRVDGLVAFFLIGDPGGIRTHDPQLRRLLLYPTELPDPRFPEITGFL